MRRKFLTGPLVQNYLPPRIRAWKSWLDEPGFTRLEVEVRRERQGLVMLPARLCLTFFHGDSIGRYDEVEWDEELDGWLISEGMKGPAGNDSEETRFSLWLRHEFRAILRRFGDGYFNAKLLEIARNDFSDDPDVQNTLADIHVVPLVPTNQSAECEQMVLEALTRVGHRIATLYGDSERAEEILGGAMAVYLDERFSVTNRELLGFASGRR